MSQVQQAVAISLSVLQRKPFGYALSEKQLQGVKLQSSGRRDAVLEERGEKSQLTSYEVEAQVHRNCEFSESSEQIFWNAGLSDVNEENSSSPSIVFIEDDENFNLVAVGDVKQEPTTLLATHYTRSICIVGSTSVPLLRVPLTLPNGKVLPALIDSGAQHCLLSEDAFNKEHFNINPNKLFKIKALGEEEGIVSLGIVELLVSLEGIEMRVEFVVVPTGVKLNADIVLGVDFLQRNSWEIDMTNRKMTKHYPDEVCCDIYDLGDGTCRRTFRNVRCVAACTVTVEPYQSERLPLRLDVSDEIREVLTKDEDMLYFEPSGEHFGSISVCPGLVNIQQCQVLVHNNEPHVKSVNLNWRVGSVSTVLEVQSEEKQEGSKFSGRVNLEHLKEDVRCQLIDLLSACSGVFSDGNSDIGLAAVTAHEILSRSQHCHLLKP